VTCGVKSEATPMPSIANQKLRGSITFPPVLVWCHRRRGQNRQSMGIRACCLRCQSTQILRVAAPPATLGRCSPVGRRCSDAEGVKAVSYPTPAFLRRGVSMSIVVKAHLFPHPLSPGRKLSGDKLPPAVFVHDGRR
jgi:hypothetical protein